MAQKTLPSKDPPARAGCTLAAGPQHPRPGETAVRNHVSVRPGLEIVIDPARTRISPEDMRHFTSGVLELATFAIDGLSGPETPNTARHS
ncbi:MAG: hypothetical protein LBR22_04615 [Desulfovibrio sp.]|nr:hypothetical protein [Desulfovibrio sp.]